MYNVNGIKYTRVQAILLRDTKFILFLTDRLLYIQVGYCCVTLLKELDEEF